MTKHSVCPFLIPLALLCTALPAFGAAETLPCADRSVTASAVHTPEDVKSFVQCAYEFVQEMGFEEARRAFNEDERWKSGPIYIFVSEATPLSDQARLFVFPPARSREGSSLGLLIARLWQRLLQGTASYRKQLRRRVALLLLHQSSDRQG